MADEVEAELALLEVPDLDALVPAARHCVDLSAGLIHSGHPHTSPASRKTVRTRALAQSIAACTDPRGRRELTDSGRLGGGGEADARDPVGVALALGGDRVLALAQGVPELDGLVAGGGHDLPVVHGEGDGEDILQVQMAGDMSENARRCDGMTACHLR